MGNKTKRNDLRMVKTFTLMIVSFTMIKCTHPHQIKEKHRSFTYKKEIDLNLTELTNKKRLFYEQLSQTTKP